MKYNIFKILMISFFISGFISCSQQTTLSESDQQLIDETAFDVEIIRGIRTYTDSSFVLSTGNPDNSFLFKDSLSYIEFATKNLKGLVFNTTKEKATLIADKLKNSFYQKGYMIYNSEMNFGYSPDKVTVLKTNDKFDLLRFEGTNGINYDLYLEDIIHQLNEWDLVYDLEFIAVGSDFVEANFTRLPKDIAGFCNELYAFCPDIVEQGTGTIEALKTEILQTRKLFLWWD